MQWIRDANQGDADIFSHIIMNPEQLRLAFPEASLDSQQELAQAVTMMLFRILAGLLGMTTSEAVAHCRRTIDNENVSVPSEKPTSEQLVSALS